MNLDGIDVFVKVVQAGGFSAAARQLGMPTTTVSAKIARLEDALGVTLIQRTTRRMHVTPVGETYYQHCLEALRVLTAGEEQLQAASREPAGLLRITAPPDIAQRLLPPIIERYLKAYPEVSVEVVVTNVQMDLLAEGIDLAVRAGPMKDSTLQSRKFGTGNLRLFASPAYLKAHGTPRTVAELRTHAIMAHARFPTGLTIKRGNDGMLLAPSGRIRADDMQTIRAFAVQGLGIALLPDLPGKPDSELEIVMPDYAMPSGTVYFVYAAGRFTPVNVSAFIDIAQIGNG